MAAARCRLCDHVEGNRTFEAREMLLGTRERFTYLACAGCQALSIEPEPERVDAYYPREYYAAPPDSALGVPGWAGTMMGGPVASLLAVGKQRGPGLERYLAGRAFAFYLAPLGLAPDARILDVGCGDGGFLRALALLGFERGCGLDPLVDPARLMDTGSSVRRVSLFELEPEPAWDLVMLHHSFEHMPAPAEALARVAALLRPGGTCLLRVPLVPCFAWERYGVDWIGLDAPRHFVIHSPRSLRRLADAAGLRIARVLHDSTSLQFWGSELYARDVALYADLPPLRKLALACGEDGERFPLAKLTAMELRAQQLNREGTGDQAAFYLVKG